MSAAVEMATSTARQNVLSMYRRLLLQSRRLPVADRASAAAQIRAAFREHKGEADSKRVKELLDLAVKKLGYLKVVTPKSRLDADASGGASSSSGGKKRYVVHEGKVVEVGDLAALAQQAGGRKAVSNWGGANLDPDDVKRHHAQMRRFTFQDRGGDGPAGRMR